MKKKSIFDTKLRYIVPAVLLVIAAVCIYWGVADGEASAVLSKATALCRECVGIG